MVGEFIAIPNSLQLKYFLHQQPFFALLGSWQGLLKRPHQHLPLLHFRIFLVGFLFCLERETLIHFHDHEHPRAEEIDFHIFDSGVTDAFFYFRPDILVETLVLRD